MQLKTTSFEVKGKYTMYIGPSADREASWACDGSCAFS